MDRISLLRAQMAAEAAEIERRRSDAAKMGGINFDGRHPALRRPRNAPRDPHESEHLIVDRDGCFRCGTRKDMHDEAGCARWRAMP